MTKTHKNNRAPLIKKNRKYTTSGKRWNTSRLVGGGEGEKLHSRCRQEHFPGEREPWESRPPRLHPWRTNFPRVMYFPARCLESAPYRARA